MSDPVEIRPERADDRAAVRRVEETAFGRPNEADLVDALRRAGAVTLSWVAVRDGTVVGHILFSPVAVASPGGGDFAAVGLGPMAVAPEEQRRGIGSQLVRAGLGELRRSGHEVAVVLGHPAFYPRFGFVRARDRGLRWEHEAPDEAFLVLELTPGALAGRVGVVRYRPEFANT